MSDLCTHTTFFASDFSSTLTCFLGSHSLLRGVEAIRIADENHLSEKLERVSVARPGNAVKSWIDPWQGNPIHPWPAWSVFGPAVVVENGFFPVDGRIRGAGCRRGRIGDKITCRSEVDPAYSQAIPRAR